MFFAMKFMKWKEAFCGDYEKRRTVLNSPPDESVLSVKAFYLIFYQNSLLHHQVFGVWLSGYNPQNQEMILKTFASISF